MSFAQQLCVSAALFVPVLVAAFLAARSAPSGDRLGCIARGWIAGAGIPVVTGAIVSAAGWAGSSLAWIAIGAVVSAITVAVIRALPDIAAPAITSNGEACEPTVVRRLRAVVFALALPVGLAWLLCLAVLPVSTPWQYDSLTYHLPRVIYAWQVGTFDFGCTSFWAQWVHPWGISAWQLWLLQIAAFRDAWLPLISVASSLVSAATMAAMVRELGGSREQQRLAALVVLGCTTVLMQSFTTMPEAPTHASLLLATAMALRAAQRADVGALTMSLLTFTLAAVMKAFALMALPLLLLPWVLSVRRIYMARPAKGSDAAMFRILALAVFVCVLIGLGTGYGRNLLTYGHPLGSVMVRSEHTYVAMPEGRSPATLTTNAARFAMEWMTPDGLPTGVSLDAAFDRWGEKLDEQLGPPMIGSAHARYPFRIGRTITPRSQEELGWPGVAAWWITLTLAVMLLGWRRNPVLLRWLALLLLGWGAMQVWSGPWDPWRGRYMVFAVGLGSVLLALQAPRWVRSAPGLLVAGTLAGLLGVSALNAVLNREGRPLVADIQRDGFGDLFGWPWEADRLRQLTSQKLWLERAALAVERVLPPDAEVALVTHERRAPDYIFMGPPWRHRRIHWPHCAETQELRLPPSATHLIYEQGAIAPQQGDLRAYGPVIVRILAPARKQ